MKHEIYVFIILTNFMVSNIRKYFQAKIDLLVVKASISPVPQAVASTAPASGGRSADRWRARHCLKTADQ